MTPERWQQTKALLQAALERAPGERAAFLSRECAVDEELRREVESLLVAHDAAGSFIEAPAYEVAAELLVKGDHAVLAAGKLVGRYEIRSRLGTGGMGEVYLAQDTRLNRPVALKLLPAEFTRDENRLRRFEQEALAASALNHPNILTIYEVGEADSVHFIAAEFIDGVTLRRHIPSTGMKVGEALDVIIQVASALAAAHGGGIVHRDIKPENIMVRGDGIVKVLDFGVAKLDEQPSASMSADPDTPPVARGLVQTEPGVIIGTAHYMSPEQARGLKVEACTDIWSLGCVLYEMITGRVPFEGATSADVFVAILEKEPPPLGWHVGDAPTELEWIVRKALRKDCGERYQTAKELLSDLKSLKQDLEFESKLESSTPLELRGSGVITRTGRQRARETARDSAERTREDATTHSTPSAEYVFNGIKQHKRGAILALAVLLLVTTGIAFGLYKLMPASKPEIKAIAPAPSVKPFTSFPGIERTPAFSPDGNQIAFVWDSERGGNLDIYVKLIDAGDPLQLTTNLDDDYSPAWSPDGRHIAFVRQSELYVIPALGGVERKVGELAFTIDGMTWSPDGKSLAVSGRSSPEEPLSIFLLSVETGDKRRLTRVPAHFDGDLSPAFSPDGQTLAFVRWVSSTVNDIYLLPVAAGGEPRRLTSDNRFIQGIAWASDNREIVFSSNRAGTRGLWRIAVVGGTPERLAGAGENAVWPAIARQGNRLAYEQTFSDTNIWRVEVPGGTMRKSRSPTKLITSTQYDSSPQFSPDSRRIAFRSDRSGSHEIWLCASDGSNPVRLTNFGGPLTGTPRWSPDGRWIAFDSRPEGQADIYVISAEGGSRRRLTTETSADVVPSFSRDGQWVYFASNRSGSYQVWKVPVEGGPAVQVTQQGGFAAFESPDGRFLYYAKGREVPGLWRVPVEGGEETPVVDSLKAWLWGCWAVVERGIYFIDITKPNATPPGTINFFDFATRRVTQLAALGNEPVAGDSGFAVSPDNRWILYAQRDQRGSDIMLVENFSVVTSTK